MLAEPTWAVRLARPEIRAGRLARSSRPTGTSGSRTARREIGGGRSERRHRSVRGTGVARRPSDPREFSTGLGWPDERVPPQGEPSFSTGSRGGSSRRPTSLFHVKHRPWPAVAGPDRGDLSELRGDGPRRDHPARAGRRALRAGADGRPRAGRDAASREHPGDGGGEPEGRGRQDHLDRERRRRARPAGAAGPRRRPRPAGQRVDRPGGPAPPRRRVDVRRPGRRHPARRGRHARRRPGEPVGRAGDDRPGRRGDRAGQRGGPGEPAGPGARVPPRHRLRRRGRRGPVRLRPHRLPAVARAADPERPGGRGRGDDPDPGGVLRARGPRAAAGDHRDGQGPPQPAAHRLLHPDHHVRRPHPARGRRGRRGARALRRPGAQDDHPALRPRVGGPVVRADGDDLRPGLARRAVLPRGRARGGPAGDPADQTGTAERQP